MSTGKVLIVKGANFSVNCIDQIDPPTPPTPSSKNLINPTECVQNKFINQDGTIGSAQDNNYAVTGFIPVNGKNITATLQGGFDSGSYHVRAYAVYDANRSFIRAAVKAELDSDGNNKMYTYENGDFYVRFNLFGYNGSQPHSSKYPDYPTYYACYGNKLLEYEPYEE